MCGIFGTIGYAADASLERCARLLSHRGPDAFGSHVDLASGVYLAHCRLAVIDLSTSGRQPMCNEKGTIWLTFNGEIYNYIELRARLEQCGHRFLSGTDSEVIIHGYEEWGERCVEELRGMFAFAIWDQIKRSLFLARDRIGIKPLYYTGDSGMFAFASEPRAIIALPGFRRKLCAEALQSFLTTRYIQGSASIYDGICRLPPGTCLRIESAAGRRHQWRYWEPAKEIVPRSDRDVDEMFRHLMGEIVKQHCVSDVPLGVFLSGGLDSASVASFATEPGKSLNTYCIRFEGWDRDEGPLARHSADILGTQHHEISIFTRDEVGLQEVMESFDEPLADTSIFPTYWICREARKAVTVALSGDGGDELFGGYSWYANMLHLNWWKRLAFAAGPGVRALGLEDTSAGRRCDELQHYLMINSPGFRVQEICSLFPDLAPELSGFHNAEVFRRCDTYGAGGVKRWQWIDMNAFLVDNNLTKIDRASMAHGLEVRVPFLDHKLVEFAFSLTEDQCLGKSGSKILLRRFAKDQGLGHLLQQPKMGFSFPVTAYWPVKDMVKRVRHGSLVQSGVMSQKVLDSFISNESGPAYPYRVWLLAVLETWFARWMC